ncbi:MAG: hypothetical protein FWF47_04565 [Clostridia bacterium]|nr:hypothetical protein [Clostridia bacterium]
MYNRMSSLHNASYSRRRNRLTQLVILLLFIAVVTFIALYSGATAFRGQYQENVVQKLRSETNAAFAQLNNLSRTGGSATESVLGKIRQHLHTADALVGQYSDLIGKELISRGVFTAATEILDKYERGRQTGQATLQHQTDLTALLDELNRLVDVIE